MYFFFKRMTETQKRCVVVVFAPAFHWCINLCGYCAKVAEITIVKPQRKAPQFTTTLYSL